VEEQLEKHGQAYTAHIEAIVEPAEAKLQAEVEEKADELVKAERDRHLQQIYASDEYQQKRANVQAMRDHAEHYRDSEEDRLETLKGQAKVSIGRLIALLLSHASILTLFISSP